MSLDDLVDRLMYATGNALALIVCVGFWALLMFGLWYGVLRIWRGIGA